MPYRESLEQATYMAMYRVAESSMEYTMDLQASGRFIPATFVGLAPMASYKIVEFLENED